MPRRAISALAAQPAHSATRRLRTAEAATVASALGVSHQCVHLTDLSIKASGLTSRHASALLSRMPALSHLKLGHMAQLDSLSFLSSLSRTLATLELHSCRHPGMLARELRRLFTLQELVHLTVVDCFAEHLDTMTTDELAAPSMRLHKLVTSVIECKDPMP